MTNRRNIFSRFFRLLVMLHKIFINSIIVRMERNLRPAVIYIRYIVETGKVFVQVSTPIM